MTKLELLQLVDGMNGRTAREALRIVIREEPDLAQDCIRAALGAPEASFKPCRVCGTHTRYRREGDAYCGGH